jgi:hypothetical protein
MIVTNASEEAVVTIFRVEDLAVRGKMRVQIELRRGNGAAISRLLRRFSNILPKYLVSHPRRQ